MTLHKLFSCLVLAAILSACVSVSSNPESASQTGWLAYILIGVGGILLGLAMVGAALTLRRPTAVEGAVLASAASPLQAAPAASPLQAAPAAPPPPAAPAAEAPPERAPEPAVPPSGFCAACGAPLPGEAAFCPRCGARK